MSLSLSISVTHKSFSFSNYSLCGMSRQFKYQLSIGHNKPLVFVSGLCFNILFEIGWFLKLSIVDMENNNVFCTKKAFVENVDYCEIKPSVFDQGIDIKPIILGKYLVGFFFFLLLIGYFLIEVISFVSFCFFSNFIAYIS